jgi:hypothetical protein
MGLSKDDILGADDLPKQEVSVPEWGGHVWVRTMTGTARDDFEAKMLGDGTKARNLENIRARMAALTVCDDTGERLFTDADIEALGGKSCAALDRILAVAQELNHFGDKDVEDLAKNSGAAQSGGSGSS